VHEADDGRAALRVLRDSDRPVDVVVSDLSMPGMDGMEFVRHLSATGAQVSLILASALQPELLASIANMARAYKVRLLGVIGKPPSAAKIVPLIELHKSYRAHAADDDATFSLNEIADAWTHNEFEAWYQPRISLADGAVRGMTVRPRWRHPTMDVLDPAVFMPSVIARGLNDDFAWMMLQKAAADCAGWQREGLDLTVSAGLAFRTLTEIDLAGKIRQIAENAELEPERMTLALPERSFNATEARTLENLARLRVDGFGLAIDQFGSGAMALEQLSLVAFTEIEIDRRYVEGTHRDEAARAGLAVALDLAQQLRLRSVADGIGSKDEWTLLQEWGCEYGQGPFISPPLPAEAVVAWTRRWSRETIR
jgi:EAL domain-containing protein (putative c-di-GMP-specific phosphodiesterase class I)